MRAVLGLGVVLMALACGGESELAPRTPVNAQHAEPTCVTAPALQDGFPAAFAQSQLDDPYRVETPPSIDLGYVGDGPLNQEPVPHRLAEWEKPFPCDWTNTCVRPAVVLVPWVPE